MEKDSRKETARRLLEAHIKKSHKRSTPERFAILDAIYDIKGWCSMAELADFLLMEKQFPVSKATLYNTIRMLEEIRLVSCHHFTDATRYTATIRQPASIVRVCTVCGGTKEVKSKSVAKMVGGLKINRFTTEGFSLMVYGLCSTCKTKITKMEKRAAMEREKSAGDASKKKTAEKKAPPAGPGLT